MAKHSRLEIQIILHQGTVSWQSQLALYGQASYSQCLQSILPISRSLQNKPCVHQWGSAIDQRDGRPARWLDGMMAPWWLENEFGRVPEFPTCEEGWWIDAMTVTFWPFCPSSAMAYGMFMGHWMCSMHSMQSMLISARRLHVLHNHLAKYPSKFLKAQLNSEGTLISASAITLSLVLSGHSRRSKNPQQPCSPVSKPVVGSSQYKTAGCVKISWANNKAATHQITKHLLTTFS